MRIRLPRELKYFVCSSLLLWLLSFGYIAAKILFYPPHHRGLPLGLLAQPPFPDISAMVGRLYLMRDATFYTEGFPWSYPAPCIFVYKFLLVLPSNPKWKGAVLIYLVVVFSGLFLLMKRLASELVRRGLKTWDAWLLLLTSALLSWPILVCLHQGNIEAMLWIGVAIAVWAYYRGMYWRSALLIGVMGSFKLYPLFLLGLFLAPRKYLQIALGVLTFVVLNVVGLAYIGPTIPIAYQRISAAVQAFSGSCFDVTVDREFLAVDHSLVSLIRTLYSDPAFLLGLHRVYMPIAAILMTGFFFAFIWKMPALNQLLVICVATVLLPPRSYDYTLQMLYIPWGRMTMLAVSAAAAGRRIDGLALVMVSLAVICSPEIFIKYQGYWAFGQFKTLFLLALLGLAAKYPLVDLC